MTPTTPPTQQERAMLEEFVDLHYKQSKVDADVTRMAEICIALNLTAEQALEEGQDLLDRRKEWPENKPYDVGAL